MTLAFLALLGAPYIYDINSLRVKGKGYADVDWNQLDQNGVHRWFV